jgi:hypothetical protein
LPPVVLTSTDRTPDREPAFLQKRSSSVGNAGSAALKAASVTENAAAAGARGESAEAAAAARAAAQHRRPLNEETGDLSRAEKLARRERRFLYPKLQVSWQNRS